MNSTLKRGLITAGCAVVLFVAGFITGRCTAPQPDNTNIPVSITTPEISGSGPVMTDLKPLETPEPKLIYLKGDTVVSENPMNLDMVNRLNALETDRARLEYLLKEVEIQKYSIPWEDDNIKITADVTSRGKLISYQPHYTIKPQTIDTTITVPTAKNKVNFLFGGGMSGNKALDKFEAEVDAAIQFKNDDILQVGYDTGGYGSVRYLKKI